MSIACRLLGLLIAIVIFAFVPLDASIAQQMGASGSTVPPPASTPDATAAPKIRLCNAIDARGLWRLIRVFETPEGASSKDFVSYPYQFIRLQPKQYIYSHVKAEKPLTPREVIRKKLDDDYVTDPKQFILDKNGALFIYKNRVFSHSYYCGIAENKAGVYRKGDMILTPTATNKKGVYELYRKMQRQNNAGAAKATTQQTKNKKTKQKKK